MNVLLPKYEHPPEWIPGDMVRDTFKYFIYLRYCGGLQLSYVQLLM